MFTFAFVATLMTLGAMGVVLLALRPRARSSKAVFSRRQMNVAVLRQQLDELAQERAQGRLGEGDYVMACEELRRRLLADTTVASADLSAGLGTAAVPARRAVLAAVAVLPVAALALYLAAGHPQLLQVTEEMSPTQGTVARGALAPGVLPQATLEQLQQHVAGTPNDARAWVLLARARLEADHFAEAGAAYARAVALSPKVARDPQIWCEWADAEALQQGSLGGRPLELVTRALALDPQHARALDLAGSAAVEARDYPTAQRYWRQLLGQLDPASPEHAQLATALDKLGRLAQPDGREDRAPVR